MPVETTSAWWRNAVAKRPVHISPDEWHAGYFLSPTPTRGVKVIARIWREPDGVFWCTIAGDLNRDGTQRVRLLSTDFWLRVANFPISEVEFKQRAAHLKPAIAAAILSGTLDLNAVPVPKWRK